MTRFGILDLLALYGLDRTAKGKLVRHQHPKYGSDLYRRRWFEPYQSFQSRFVFDGCDFIVSFVGAGGTDLAPKS